jgi:hypothetical protein
LHHHDLLNYLKDIFEIGAFWVVEFRHWWPSTWLLLIHSQNIVYNKSINVKKWEYSLKRRPMGHNVFHAVPFDKTSSRAVDFQMHYVNGNDVNNLTNAANFNFDIVCTVQCTELLIYVTNFACNKSVFCVLTKIVYCVVTENFNVYAIIYRIFSNLILTLFKVSEG